MTADDELFDEVIGHTLDIFRLSARQRQQVLRRLEEMEKELSAKLSDKELSAVSRAEIEKFLSETDRIIGAHYGDIAAAQIAQFPSTGEVIAKATAEAIEVVLGKAANLPLADYFAALAKDFLIQGSPAADWWRGQSVDLQDKFKRQVRIGLANSETNNQIVKRIVGKDGEPGIIEGAKRHAAALVQTSAQAVANDARRTTFQNNSDIIKGIKQVSTLDSRTSDICMAYSDAQWDLDYEPINGNTLPFNGGCPRHFNCRSVEVPITKSFKELGVNIAEPTGTTRASDEGQISVSTSFDDFLKRKGKAYQDEALGEGRAELWRAGKITLRDLVSGDGRPLSLSELQAKYNPPFSAAKYAAKFDNPNVTPASIISQFPANTKSKIDDAERRLSKLTATNKLYSKNGVYNQKRQKLHEDILYNGVQGYDPDTGAKKFYPGILAQDKVEASLSDKPTFTILGGRGGSGKSAFNGKKFAEAKVYDEHTSLVFDSDVIKHMLPEFKGFNANQVHEESSYILGIALKEARKKNANVVLDGTLKTRETAIDNVNTFIADGYKIEAHYMFLPREEAAKRAVERFLSPTGRYVPAKIILDNVNNESNFDEIIKIADNWSFRDNNVARGQAPKLIAKKVL